MFEYLNTKLLALPTKIVLKMSSSRQEAAAACEKVEWNSCFKCLNAQLAWNQNSNFSQKNI